MRITRPIGPNEVHTSHCEQAFVNGVSVSPDALGQRLAEVAWDTLTVSLVNEGVSADFSLRVEVALETDIAGVERCFFDVARRGRLDMRAVEDFIAAARAHPTAIAYCDGVCEYFYGVLVKERPEESSLPYEAYRGKFNRAADVLKDFDRPLAHTVGALIAFHFNTFSECTGVPNPSRVGAACARFGRWINGGTDGVDRGISDPLDDRLERLLTDFETERLLGWSVADLGALQQEAPVMEALVRQDIPEFDRTKLHVLLAELYAHAGDPPAARPHARELRNSPTLGAWSERLLDRLSGLE